MSKEGGRDIIISRDRKVPSIYDVTPYITFYSSAGVHWWTNQVHSAFHKPKMKASGLVIIISKMMGLFLLLISIPDAAQRTVSVFFAL